MKELILKQFIAESRDFCAVHGVAIKDVRQEYFEARPFVSFWVDSEVIISISFSSLKQGLKYSLVIKECFVQQFEYVFGEPSSPTGNKKKSNTWKTKDISELLRMVSWGKSENLSYKESRFQNELESLYSLVGKSTGYWANYYLRAVKEHGAVTYAKKALSKGGATQEGFQTLIDVGRPDLSMEYAVLKPEYQGLFTEEEFEIAKNRLSSVPDYAWRKDVLPSDNFFGEISNTETFSEGAKQVVTVNRYERNPKARLECLKKHGYKCKVCDFSFAEMYGDIGRKFIHVHHIKPLAGIEKDYEVNPAKDLVPVCPNCHAMLHTKNPPLSVYELKAVLNNNTVSKN